MLHTSTVRPLFALIGLLCIGCHSTTHGNGEHRAPAPALASFAPDAVAELETQMWRDYYDGHWMDLSAGLMELAKDQFGFSTDESVRMAMSAGQAAMLFRSNPADPRCQQQLQTFYRIVQSRSASEFSVEKAAELELSWWRKRRENAPAADYATDIAALSEMLFGLPKNAALPAALIRVEAMVYRDERRDGLMTDADWEHIHRRLQVAYQKLHRAIHDAPE